MPQLPQPSRKSSKKEKAAMNSGESTLNRTRVVITALMIAAMLCLAFPMPAQGGDPPANAQGPRTKPEDWNMPDTIRGNNCYNYATDNMNTPNQGKPTLPAEPGAVGGVDPHIPTPAKTKDGKVRIDKRLTPKSLRDALISDGLHEKEVCIAENHTGCWRVAYFIDVDEGEGKPEDKPREDDYHFVREDSPGKWSHKCCWQHEASDGRITRIYKRGSFEMPFFGEPIKDPATEVVKPGCKFHGYLYANRKTRVAHPVIAQIERYGEAIKRDPKNAGAYYKRGWLYIKIGETTRALSDFSRTIELEPKNASYYAARGYTYYESGHCQKALDDLEKAASLDSSWKKRLSGSIEKIRRQLEKEAERKKKESPPKGKVEKKESKAEDKVSRAPNQSVGLGWGWSQGLRVVFVPSGKNYGDIGDLVVTNTTAKEVTFTVPQGMLLDSSDAAVQDLYVADVPTETPCSGAEMLDKPTTLGPRETRIYEDVPGFCADLELAVPAEGDCTIYTAREPDDKSRVLLAAIEAAKEFNVGRMKLNAFEEKKARQMLCQGALWMTDSRIDEVEGNEVSTAALQAKYWQTFETAAGAKLEQMTSKQREGVETLVREDIKTIVSATDFIAKQQTKREKTGQRDPNHDG